MNKILKIVLVSLLIIMLSGCNLAHEDKTKKEESSYLCGFLIYLTYNNVDFPSVDLDNEKAIYYYCETNDSSAIFKGNLENFYKIDKNALTNSPMENGSFEFKGTLNYMESTSDCTFTICYVYYYPETSSYQIDHTHDSLINVGQYSASTSITHRQDVEENLVKDGKEVKNTYHASVEIELMEMTEIDYVKVYEYDINNSLIESKLVNGLDYTTNSNTEYVVIEEKRLDESYKRCVISKDDEEKEYIISSALENGLFNNECVTFSFS